MSPRDKHRSIRTATELAKLGATISLVVKLVGISKRWARVIVQDVKGEITESDRRRSDIADWLDQDPNRRMEATTFIQAYNSTQSTWTRTRRVISAYRTYQLTSSDNPLSIDQCCEILELYEDSGAWLESCSNCFSWHLVVRETPLCPVCLSLDGLLCKHCKRPIESDTRTEKRGRRPIYCKRPDCVKERELALSKRKSMRGTDIVA